MSTENPSQTDIQEATKAAQNADSRPKDNYGILRDCIDTAKEKNVQGWTEAVLTLSMFKSRTDGILPRQTHTGKTARCRTCGRIPDNESDEHTAWEAPGGAYCPPCALRLLLDLLA